MHSDKTFVVEGLMWPDVGTFEVIDCTTGDLFGPYHFLSEARAQASRFKHWEIVSNGQLVCEGRSPMHSDEAVIPH
jgi:hypothetical protein